MFESHALQRSAANRVSLYDALSSTQTANSTQCRIKSAFSTMEELNHMWGFAEDLESYEYVCKDLLSLFTGPVSRRTPIYLPQCFTDGRISLPTMISKTRYERSLSGCRGFG